MTLYKIDEDTQIDEFGVNHSKFSLRDELEYNLKRAKEKERNQSIYPSKAENFENLFETIFADSVQKARQQCWEPERLHRYFSHTMNNNIVHPNHYTVGEIAQSAASGFGQ